MAIKDIFSRRYPIDKTVIGRFGRLSLVRGTFPNANGTPCLYGLYMPGRDNIPTTDDGVVLSFDEVTQLAELLPVLIAKGEVRQMTPPAEYKATMEAIEAAKKAPLQLW